MMVMADETARPPMACVSYITAISLMGGDEGFLRGWVRYIMDTLDERVDLCQPSDTAPETEPFWAEVVRVAESRTATSYPGRDYETVHRGQVERLDEATKAEVSS